MAKLIELLTEHEAKKISSRKWGGNSIDLHTEVKDLTVEQLNNISFIVIETQYKDEIPKMVLCAAAIDILVSRAIIRGLSIYKL